MPLVLAIEVCFKVEPFKGRQNLEPRPDWSPLGALAPGGGKMRDPGNEVDFRRVSLAFHNGVLPGCSE